MSQEALSLAAQTAGTTTGDLLLRTPAGGILVVEPDVAETRRLVGLLGEALGPQTRVVAVRDLAAARRRILEGDLALALLSLSIPGVQALDGLRELQHADARLPVVVMARQSDQRMGLRAVKAGAQDFLVRSKVDARSLRQAAQYAVERKRSEARLAFLALHDPLTGLANRVQFRERLADAIERCERTRGRVGVLFVDLDHFKQVNDTLGHDAGDLLLKEVANRLSASVRSFELVARNGGDEFVVLLENLGGADDATAVARRILAALAKPFGLGPASRPISTSIGIAIHEPGDTVDSLIDKADRAMYRAKEAGRSTFAVYVSSSLTEELAQIRDDVGAGLRKLGFEVRFEPRMHVDRDRVLAAEARLVWRHPVHGPLEGEAVWGHLDRARVLDAVIPWWLEHCALNAVRWDDARRLRVTIPIPDTYVLRPGFVEQIGAALIRAEIDPGRVEILLTEDFVRTERRELALERLETLKKIGLRVALDDFGARCGLEDLARLPVDTIKLHSVLTHDITTSTRRRALLQAVVSLADQLGIETVVREVETLEEEDVLTQIGCTALAGTVVGPALPSEAFPIWLAHLDSTDLL